MSVTLSAPNCVLHALVAFTVFTYFHALPFGVPALFGKALELVPYYVLILLPMSLQVKYRFCDGAHKEMLMNTCPYKQDLFLQSKGGFFKAYHFLGPELACLLKGVAL